MKNYIAALSLVLFGFPLVIAGEYPVGLAVSPSGATLVFSSERVVRTSDSLPITLESHMIEKAILWKQEWFEDSSGTLFPVLAQRKVDPNLAAQFAPFYIGNCMRAGLEIHFKEPTIQ